MEMLACFNTSTSGRWIVAWHPQRLLCLFLSIRYRPRLPLARPPIQARQQQQQQQQHAPRPVTDRQQSAASGQWSQEQGGPGDARLRWPRVARPRRPPQMAPRRQGHWLAGPGRAGQLPPSHVSERAALRNDRPFRFLHCHASTPERAAAGPNLTLHLGPWKSPPP